MTVHRLMTDIIPQTLEGQQFADLYENKLKDTNAFVDRRDSTQNIQITAEYYFDVSEEEE